jgi:hypothetical protein
MVLEIYKITGALFFLALYNSNNEDLLYKYKNIFSKDGVGKTNIGNEKTKNGITKGKYGIVKTYFVFVIPNIGCAVPMFEFGKAYYGK